MLRSRYTTLAPTTRHVQPGLDPNTCSRRCLATLGVIPQLGRVAIVLIATLLITLNAQTSLHAQPHATPDSRSVPNDFIIETQYTGLAQPVAFAFAPDGRIFVNERTTGQLRVIPSFTTRDPRADDDLAIPNSEFETIMQFDVCCSGERGLLGLALHPDFENDPSIFVFYSASETHQRIVRLQLADALSNVVIKTEVIVDNIPASSVHNGGNIGFGPDGMLYFTVGDNGRPEYANDASRIPGKIHRVHPDGRIPADNPWPGRSTYSRGFRNSFDFTFDPQLPVVIFASENGTNIDDEVNRILAGEDYGWPTVSGRANKPPFIDPLATWSPTTAPVGITFYGVTGALWAQYPAQYRNSLYVAEFVTGQIRRLQLDADRSRVIATETFFRGGLGPLLDVVVAPDGSLWFSTHRGLYNIRHRYPPHPFIRGNVDGIGSVDYLDFFALSAYLLGTGPDLPCLAAADVNDDGVVDEEDQRTLFDFIRGDIHELPAPFPNPGLDPDHALECR